MQIAKLTSLTLQVYINNYNNYILLYVTYKITHLLIYHIKYSKYNYQHNTITLFTYSDSSNTIQIAKLTSLTLQVYINNYNNYILLYVTYKITHLLIYHIKYSKYSYQHNTLILFTYSNSSNTIQIAKLASLTLQLYINNYNNYIVTYKITHLLIYHIKYCK